MAYFMLEFLNQVLELYMKWANPDNAKYANCATEYIHCVAVWCRLNWLVYNTVLRYYKLTSDHGDLGLVESGL